DRHGALPVQSVQLHGSGLSDPHPFDRVCLDGRAWASRRLGWRDAARTAVPARSKPPRLDYVDRDTGFAGACDPDPRLWDQSGTGRAGTSLDVRLPGAASSGCSCSAIDSGPGDVVLDPEQEQSLCVVVRSSTRLCMATMNWPA